MATDKLFYEFATHFPNALAKLIEAEPDEYEAKSIAFKETERRADLFLIGRSGQHVVLVEAQGYRNRELYYQMVKKLVFYCTQFTYRGRIDAAAIFLEASHHKAADAFERQFARSGVLQFRPHVLVLGQTDLERLLRHDDVHLTPLLPLCKISPQEIEQQAPVWVERIDRAPGLQTQERDNLFAFLAGAISHRLKNLTIDDIHRLFGGFAMEDTPLGQQLLEMGRKKGIEEGVKQGMKQGMKQGVKQGMKQGVKQGMPRGIQHVILKLIAARFGKVPTDIRRKIRAIDRTDELEVIATRLLTIQSLDELKKLIN